MILPDIIKNIYTNPKSDWMKELDDSDIPAYVIQLLLVGNDHIRTQVRWLDKYVFTLPAKMYLSLAWSIIPKSKSVPYRTDMLNIDENNDPYLSKENNKYDFLIDKIRKQFELGDNDYNSLKGRLINAIEKDLSGWFTYYGVEKVHWKKFNINQNMMKNKGATLSSFI